MTEMSREKLGHRRSLSRRFGPARWLGLTLVGILGLATVCDAQSEARSERKKDPQRARTLVVLRISEALDLDEEQTLRLGSEYRRFDKGRRELLQQRAGIEVELEEALADPEPDPRRLTESTQRLLAVDRELVLMPDTFFESVQGMLDVEQRARLALLKIKLQRRIDRERGKRGGHAGRPRGPERRGHGVMPARPVR